MAQKRMTHQDLLPEKTFGFEYSLDENRLKLTSTTDERIEFELAFTDQPAGQQHHLSQFLFDVWGDGFNQGRKYQTKNPDETPPTADKPSRASGVAKPTNPATGNPAEGPRAVDLTKADDHRLEGPCPSCGELIRISTDMFYNQFHGACPSCNKGVAYRAPDGTFRSNVIDPAPGIWQVDRRHYCMQCRYEIPFCQCSPPVDMPTGYAETSRAPWELPRNDL